MESTPCFVLFSVLLGFVSSQRQDLTTVPGSNGVNVVRAVLSKLDESRIFEQSGNADLMNVFLRNMAYVETADGTAFPQENADGGIWKITAMQFQRTKELPPSRHSRVYDNITAYLGQDWRAVEYRDLEKPLYSGLAARLYLTYVATYTIIPPSLRQGLFWSEKFKSNKGDLLRWITAVTRLQEIEVCSVNTDVVFVLDSSGSINNADPTNYDKVKNYTRAFVDALIDENPEGEGDRIGVVIYGAFSRIILPLNESTNLDKRSLLKHIDRIPYLRGWTNTADGLCRAIEQPWRESLSVLRLIITLTDGRSNQVSPICGNTTTAASQVHAAYPPLLSYAIGVANARVNELLTIATTPELIDHLDSFNTDLLTAAQEARSYQICFTVDQPQRIGNPEQGTTGLGDSVRISFSPPAEEGITVRICIHEGQIVLYASTSVPNPSAALHDWSTMLRAPQYQHTIVCSTTYFDNLDMPNLTPKVVSPAGKSTPRGKRQASSDEEEPSDDNDGDATVTLYISIEGQMNYNEFSLNSSVGQYDFDVNECLLNPCHVNADCNNTDGSFYCYCQSGYLGDGFQCTDIDECLLADSLCHANAICQNSEGSFTCTCAEGYEGDGTNSCRAIGVRLLIILVPTINGVGLILLAVVVIILLVIKCQQRKYPDSKHTRKKPTVI